MKERYKYALNNGKAKQMINADLGRPTKIKTVWSECHVKKGQESQWQLFNQAELPYLPPQLYMKLEKDDEENGTTNDCIDDQIILPAATPKQ